MQKIRRLKELRQDELSIVGSISGVVNARSIIILEEHEAGVLDAVGHGFAFGIPGSHLTQGRIQFDLQIFEREKIFQFSEELTAERARQTQFVELAFEKAFLIGRIGYLLRLDQK